MDIKHATVLITGGAGFIGSHILDSLISQVKKVIVYDNLSSGNLDNIKKNRKEVEFIKGDILNYSLLVRSLKNVDIVSHQAAHLEILKCVDDPIEDLTNNCIGTINVLKASRARNIRKILIASSACVYGQPTVLPQIENHPTEPNWEYGIGKLAAEKYSTIFSDRYGMDITNLRYGIVYGPREWYGRVLTLFIKRAVQKKPLIIFGDGNQKRDFIHVSDIVSLHTVCLINDKSRSEIFNAATGVATSITQLALLVKSLTHSDIEITYENISEGQISRYFNRKRLVSELKAMVLSPEKALKKLGWQPVKQLSQGIREEIEWYKNHKTRWKKIAI